MSDPYIQQLFAERIGGADYGKSTAIYKFEKIKRAKAAARKAKPGVELIDMGVGEPDEMADAQVVEALRTEAGRAENRGYADNGGPEFKAAAARYMKAVLGVDIDPVKEVNHAIGNKAALRILALCFINPGDVAIMTVPGYPVLGTHAKYLGGEVYNCPLTAENNFLPDLEAIPADIARRAKVMVLNYPNNPTGATATPAFYEKAIAFAQANDVILVNDAAYASLIFEGQPLSFLQLPGGKDVGVELHSLSKSFNMTGWRISWVCGHPLIVKAFADMKDNCDSGQFLAIQQAAAVALDNPAITERISEKYSRRMDLLVETLAGAGFAVTKPKGSFFLYTAAPKSAEKNGETVTFASGEDFSQFLIKELLISTVPWDDAGNFVRFSVTFEGKGETEEQRVIGEIKQRLSQYKFAF